MTNPQAKISRTRYFLLIPFLAALFFMIAVTIINPVEYPNSDFFTFWLAGRLFFLGQDPYNSQAWISGHHQFGATWIPNPTFVYPMPLSLLFAPLGLLPLYQAFIVWDTLSQFMIAASIALLFAINSNSNFPYKHFVLPVLLEVALFRPTILTLVNGQLSGMLLLITTAVVYLWEKEKWVPGAALLAALALKPNLGIPIIVLLSIYLILQKRTSSLVALMISGMLLVLVGLAQNPNWVIEFWGAGNAKVSQTFWFTPTIWGASAFLCNYNLSCTLGYGICLSFLFLTGYLYLLAKKRNISSPSLAAGLATVITLLLTPYTWPYDQLLLVVPIVTIVMMLAKDGHGYLPVALLFLAIDVLAFVLLGISGMIQMEIWNVFIPLVVFGLLIGYLPKNSDSGNDRNCSPQSHGCIVGSSLQDDMKKAEGRMPTSVETLGSYPMSQKSTPPKATPPSAQAMLTRSLPKPLQPRTCNVRSPQV